MIDMIKILEDHPYSFIFDEVLSNDTDLTLSDLKEVVQKNKLGTITDGVGLTNFESLIQKLFETSESKLTTLHRDMLGKLSEQKKEYIEGASKDICNLFMCKLNISDREEILNMPQFKDKIVIQKSNGERELRLNASYVDEVIEFQRAIAQKIENRAAKVSQTNTQQEETQEKAVDSNVETSVVDCEVNTSPTDDASVPQTKMNDENEDY